MWVCHVVAKGGKQAHWVSAFTALEDILGAYLDLDAATASALIRLFPFRSMPYDVWNFIIQSRKARRVSVCGLSTQVGGKLVVYQRGGGSGGLMALVAGGGGRGRGGRIVVGGDSGNGSGCGGGGGSCSNRAGKRRRSQTRQLRSLIVASYTLTTCRKQQEQIHDFHQAQERKRPPSFDHSRLPYHQHLQRQYNSSTVVSMTSGDLTVWNQADAGKANYSTALLQSTLFVVVVCLSV